MFGKTNEEKVALKIISLMSDFMLDTRMLGFYLARVAPKEIIGKMHEVANSAYLECDRIEQVTKLREDKNNGNTLF